MQRFDSGTLPTTMMVLVVKALLMASTETVMAATAIDFRRLIEQERLKIAKQETTINPVAATILDFPRKVLVTVDHEVKNAPQKVWYVPDFISVDEERRLLAAVESDGGWSNLGRRKLKHYGGVPDNVQGMVADTLPMFMSEVCRAVAQCGVWDVNEPNQVCCFSRLKYMH
jgi:hypothetical protein